MEFPAVLPPLGADGVGLSGHWSHPSGRQAMRWIVLATTPGDISRWRGMFAVWAPQGQIHLVWIPASDLITHPVARRAASTRRRRSGFVTPTILGGLVRCEGAFGEVPLRDPAPPAPPESKRAAQVPHTSGPPPRHMIQSARITSTGSDRAGCCSPKSAHPERRRWRRLPDGTRRGPGRVGRGLRHAAALRVGVRLSISRCPYSAPQWRQSMPSISRETRSI